MSIDPELLMAYADGELGPIEAKRVERAIAADPAWPLPHAIKAGYLWSLTEAAFEPEAAQHLERAQALVHAATPARERAHLEALQLIAQGRWAAACRAWDLLLIDHPRDVLALQWAQLWDFYRGDSAALRARPAVPADIRIHVPTLLIWGAQDKFIGRWLADACIAQCDDGRLEVIDDATHWVQHEEPARVNRWLIDFLKA